MVNEPAGRTTRYEVVVKDRLSPRFATAFEGLELVAGRGQTILRGEFVDQSQLHGLIERLRDLGIELVSVNAVD
jgi:hypothetical protein